MYSVFIVDDEVIVREGLRNKIDWDTTEFNLIGEASDGELALSMIQDMKPDILITDIRMPFMDGLELAKMAKKLQPWIKIIILSGHDEFEYAKKAISIGVQEYILKPFTSEEILNALQKTAAVLDQEKKQVSDISNIKNELESNATLMKKKLLTDIVMGTVSGIDAVQKTAEMDINLISRFYCVTVSEIRSNTDSSNDIVTAQTHLVSFINSKPDIIPFFIAPDKLVCISKSSDDSTLEDDAYNLGDSIQYEILKHTNCSIITAIGTVVDRTALISKSYEDSEKILRLCRYGGRNRIVGINDITKDSEESLSFIEKDPLVDRLKFSSDTDVNQIIEEYVKMIDKTPDHFSGVASYLLIDVIYGVSKLIEELGGDIKDIMPEILTHKYVDDSVKTKEIFIDAIKMIFEKTLAYRNTRMQGRYGDVILRAKKYIEQNFSDPDICLHSVAEEIALSPNHFSTIFSQECGMTFIEYLTSVRIEQAKKLLHQGQMKTADIAYEVGFSDPHYFSFIFKKTTGCTPRDFKYGSEEKNLSQV